VTLKCIYVRNPLSFNFSPKKRLIKGNLTFTTPILLILSLNILLLSVNRLTISYSYLIVTSCELVSAILVLLSNPKVVAAVDAVVATTFSGILFNFFYHNLGSKYIIKPCRKYSGRLINRLGI